MGDGHMERKVGTISRGIRCPIIRENDDLAKIVVDSVLDAAMSEGFEIRDRDVIAMTESIVARAQGNYASVDAVAEDVRAKFGGETVGVIFPILSRTAAKIVKQFRRSYRQIIGQRQKTEASRGESFCFLIVRFNWDQPNFA